MTNEEISVHSLYQLDNIPADSEKFKSCLGNVSSVSETVASFSVCTCVYSLNDH